MRRMCENRISGARVGGRGGVPESFLESAISVRIRQSLQKHLGRPVPCEQGAADRLRLMPPTPTSNNPCGCSTDALQIRVPRGRILMNKNQNGSAKVPKATNIETTGYRKGTNMEPKGCQHEQTLLQHLDIFSFFTSVSYHN